MTSSTRGPAAARSGFVILGCLALGVVGLSAAAVAWSDEAPGARPAGEAAAVGAVPANPRVAAARERAKLVHDIYTVTLDVMHERYFRNDRSTIPARAMEDVFAEVARTNKIDARWIGVNARTMGINHEPKDEFEKNAARAIGSGQEDFEAVENGVYRRAQGVPLAVGCLTCHGSFGMVPKTPRFAGLVINIPVDKEPAARPADAK